MTPSIEHFFPHGFLPDNQVESSPSNRVCRGRSNYCSSNCITMSMDIKGITWVGNMYQKFENMWLEVEETMLEETVKYMEKTVGESVKKIYSDVMQDLVPPSSCHLGEKQVPELPVDQYTDADFCKKSFQGSMKITIKPDTKLTTKDSRTKNDVDIGVIHAESYDADVSIMSVSGNSVKGNNFISHTGRHVRSTDTSELSNVNQTQEATVSQPASTEVTTLASVADCCNEFGNENTEHILNVLKSDEEKEDMSSSSIVLYGDPYEFSMVSTMQPEDCCCDTVIVSRPEVAETWNLDIAEVDSVKEQGRKTTQFDELKLEETCVMVTRDDLQFVPKARVNSKTSKRPFSLSKKFARKQEYEELAIWHGNNEKGKNGCLENSGRTLQEDQKELLLPGISEPEWELL
ncbi:uncharacterized protein LOC130746854 isoform X2 [Lotus japonicus]|uniref:uncharacterized protein LOC130746854 isoform X2 n=1 Tax=Lotus japonicus TaxID=34305 RepID=UPI002590C519|nr:uncharacterized protein LOC130746854 isoform X2 [Lotus japonicus]